MSLAGTIVLRPNEFSQPDYSVVYKDHDGREVTVGRIFRNDGLVGGERPWFWGVEFFQRQGRAEPHQGQVDTLEEAKAAWRNVGIHRRRSIGRLRCSGAAMKIAARIRVRFRLLKLYADAGFAAPNYTA